MKLDALMSAEEVGARYVSYQSSDEHPIMKSVPSMMNWPFPELQSNSVLEASIWPPSLTLTKVLPSAPA
ncbi:MAG: hypothetical protein A4E32_00090 [Methanomassiliicoccales archaeon PtaU1.Bin124]|nr:MAG: hypothetical protein A4E32_00090 [Methanomassiliicoccales archaeon PtaU1.Bin124]